MRLMTQCNEKGFELEVSAYFDAMKCSEGIEVKMFLPEARSNFAILNLWTFSFFDNKYVIS